MPPVPGARRSKLSASLPVTSDSGRSYAFHVSLRSQSIDRGRIGLRDLDLAALA